ncbi:Dolichol-phosphate mannosyltransferase in lipid-linked oligosaccharide synthesis cluster [Streptococcus sp. DD11]|uniref:glycosyltransferase n=1 Tax=Streptococcus sp. DD11 TaxID=1777879 RepID=UPI000796CF5F|nr:glycosyltransferase [Streptococcus sp. DD11]KXT85154.1 Dolichol-phosphate mannosyltransferase in lipid-linked oligosaccharide synthesis cluster [Streptococcus sp. DD11]
MISIAMATYNGAGFVLEQLDSIRMQKMKADQVIICDDCSTDQTVALVKDYIAKHQLTNWQLIENQENIGHYQTFIKLAGLAEHDVVFFADQDDKWLPDKTAALYKVLSETGAAMVYGRSYVIDQDGQIIKESKVSEERRERDLAYLLKNWPSGYQTAFRRSVLTDIIQQQYKDYPGFDYHDVLFGMLAPLYGRVIDVGQILDQHRIHQSNVTQSAASLSFTKTRRSRIDYLQKVVRRYESILKIARERQASEQACRQANKALALTERRLRFLQSRNPFLALGLLFQIREYKSIKDFVSDIVYTYSLNGVARKLLKKFGR